MFPTRKSCVYAWVIVACGCCHAASSPPPYVKSYSNARTIDSATAKQKRKYRQYVGQWDYGTAKSHSKLMVEQGKLFFPKDLQGKYWGVGVASTSDGALTACAVPPEKYYSIVESGVAYSQATGKWYACIIFSR